MPQMSPMNWILISILFFLVWIMFKIYLNSFSFKTNEKKIFAKLMEFTW